MSNKLGFSIEPASVKDAAEITQLVRAAYSKWIAPLGREPLPMKADYHQAIRKHRVDVLYADGRIVGVIELVQHPTHFWIENVAVSPKAQGRGYGHKLLDHAERVASELGYSELRLLTNSVFESNVTLYQAFGYRIDRVEPFTEGSTVYMCKQLNGRHPGGLP